MKKLNLANFGQLLNREELKDFVGGAFCVGINQVCNVINDNCCSGLTCVGGICVPAEDQQECTMFCKLGFTNIAAYGVPSCSPPIPTYLCPPETDQITCGCI